jgi:hypothetical protein
MATLASKLSIIRFRVFAQGREVSRKESDQAKTLSEWGFKDLEAIMIQVQERVKEDPLVRKISAPETLVSSRFNEIHALLSGDPHLAYTSSKFLINMPPEPTFVARLQNLDTPWEELFSTTFPWDLHYSVYALHSCLIAYKREDPDAQWVAEFGQQKYEKLVDLIEWLSFPPFVTANDWPYTLTFAVGILDRFLHLGT